MRFILQQPTKRNCGQIALAILTGQLLESVQEFIGHSHSTSTKELTRLLRVLGYSCPSRRPILRDFSNLPLNAFGIIHIRENGKLRGGHWVAVKEGKAFDGCRSQPWPLEYYARTTVEVGWRITSFLPVTKSSRGKRVN